MKITVEDYNVKISLEDLDDIDVHDLLEHFKTFTIGIGYLPKTFDDAIINYYHNNNLNSDNEL